MPAPLQNLTPTSTLATARVELEPVNNAIQSLVLLERTNELSGLGEWVHNTVAAMSAEERRRNYLVMIGFYNAVIPERSYPGFTSYLRHLERMAPQALLDKLMHRYARMPLKDAECCNPLDELPADYDQTQVLASATNYIDFLRQRFDESLIDVELETEAHRYATQPAAMKELIVNHLRFMWDQYLSAEWEHVTPLLQSAVSAFRQVDLSHLSKLEAARLVTGKDLEEDKWQRILDRANRVTFVPNAHIGPYLWAFVQEDTVCVVFGARLPTGSQVDAPDLSRAEIIVRLNALADDNRLRILRYILENGEQRSQDLIQNLELSQSAASRHLQQLSATGYLSERRCEGAKCYQINPERIEETLQAIAAFLINKPFSKMDIRQFNN